MFGYRHYPLWTAMFLFASGCRRQAAPVYTPPPPVTPQQQTKTQPQPPPPSPARRQTKPSAPQPAAPTPAPAVEAPPQLGILLSPEEQQRLNSEIDEDLRQARGTVARLNSRQLAEAHHDTMEQIRSFIAQTETLRKTDLPAARGLARKAAVLAADLEARTR